MKKVLVTGAAGRIGSAFWQMHGERFDLRLGDIHAIDSGSRCDFIELDITDAQACMRACEGIDTVIHLAADPSADADFQTSVLPVIINGTFNMLEAAKAQGCRRFVYASSAQAIEGYPLDVQVSESMAPRPKNFYGAGKAFGEALTSLYALSGEMVGVAVRIANVAEFSSGELHSARDMAAFISDGDVVALLARCVEADLSGFHVVNGVSDNRYKRLSLELTRSLLNYQPKDDAFKIVEAPARVK